MMFVMSKSFFILTKSNLSIKKNNFSFHISYIYELVFAFGETQGQSVILYVL